MYKKPSNSKSSFLKRKDYSSAGMNKQEYDRLYSKMSANKKNKGKRNFKKFLIIFGCVLLSLAIIFASTYAYLYYSGKSQLKTTDVSSIKIGKKQDDENVVESGGKKYKFDKDVISVLCIGVDKDDHVQKEQGSLGKGGQSDALFLLCIDIEDAEYTVISINRDALVDVDVYSESGKYVGIQKQQACLSFAYVDGKHTSCKNTKKAISRLFYGIPINSYFAINKICIPVINDTVDGVQVPVYDENGNLTGETDHLDGNEAYKYIHDRDTSRNDSNEIRLKRQTSYIKAFASKLITRTKSDLSTPVDVFKTISIYSTTNVGASKITYLTTEAFSHKDEIKIDYKSVPGKSKTGKQGYTEFHVDTDALLELVLDVFYDEVK